MWRSLVAHLTGGQGVAGSNPVIPTIFTREKGRSDDWPFVFLPFDSLSDSLTSGRQWIERTILEFESSNL